MTDSIDALIAEGKKLHAQDQLAEASQRYQHVLALDSAHCEASHLMGLVHFQQGELEQAETLIRSAIGEQQGSCRLHCNLGAVLMAGRRYPEAHGTFETALSFDAEDPDARYNLGLAAQAMGRFSEAIDSYQQVLEQQPESFDVKMNLGIALRDAGLLEESEAGFKELLPVAPDLVPLHYNLGITFKLRGKWQEAVDAFRRCIELDESFSDGLFALATTLTDSGDSSITAKEYAHFCQQFPNMPRLHSTFGTVLLEFEDFDGAVTALELAIAQDADNTELNYALSLAQLRRNNPEAALVAIEKNLNSLPASSRELANKVTALAMLDRSEQVNSLVNADKLIAVYHPKELPEVGLEANFTETLASFISEHSALQKSPPGAIIDDGYLLPALLESQAQEPVAGLIRLLEAGIDNYLQTHPRETQHPTLSLRPPRKRLTAWGQIISAGAKQRHHIHPGAWLSGILYLKVPDGIHSDDESHAGWLELGGADPIYALDTPPQSRWVCPQEAMLVVFPSWYYQHSTPHGGGDSCVGVAFDVIAVNE